MAEICPATGAVGAEITGIDLSEINDADFHRLRSALDQYLVIRLRNQQLDRFQLSSLAGRFGLCLLYTSPSPRDRTRSRMPSSA